MVYPGSIKMYHDLKMTYWWRWIKKDVVQFVTNCIICQKFKVYDKKPKGLLQSLPVPKWKWDDVTMDFMQGLPHTSQCHNFILVIVDCLTKFAYFISIKTWYLVNALSKLYIQEIVWLYGIPKSIVPNWDPKFTSHFWKCEKEALGT